MGYTIEQYAVPVVPVPGRWHYVVAAVDAVEDFDAMPDVMDGSVAYIRHHPDTLYLHINGAWTSMKKSALPNGQLMNLDGTNPYTMIMANNLFARHADVAAMLESDRRQYYVRDELPTEQGTDALGMIVYNLTDSTLNVCTTLAITEIDTLTVTKGAETAAGNVTITLNNVATTVAVEKDDTAAGVADIIAATAFTGWTVGRGAGATVLFSKVESGAVQAPAFDDTGITGTTATFACTQTGVTGVWGALSIAT